MNYQESFRKKESSFYFRIVHEEIGIKLTRGESTTLTAIIHSFEKAKKRGKRYLIPKVEGAFKFYFDVFGLNRFELLEELDWLENKEFKEYCRRNVHKWREEN